ncbi:hypothetical protein SNEBB_009009 [Seison nebaliae]|nr:hypothetical protein SNEBB_009009 [Seison nebaliae]
MSIIFDWIFETPDASFDEQVRDFGCSTVSHKSVREIPGMDECLAECLERICCCKAYQLLGKFLAIDRSLLNFKRWLVCDMKADTSTAERVGHALDEWCRRNL